MVNFSTSLSPPEAITLRPCRSLSKAAVGLEFPYWFRQSVFLPKQCYVCGLNQFRNYTVCCNWLALIISHIEKGLEQPSLVPFRRGERTARPWAWACEGGLRPCSPSAVSIPVHSEVLKAKDVKKANGSPDTFEFLGRRSVNCSVDLLHDPHKKSPINSLQHPRDGAHWDSLAVCPARLCHHFTLDAIGSSKARPITRQSLRTCSPAFCARLLAWFKASRTIM